MTEEDKKYEALCDAPNGELSDFMDNASAEELAKLAAAAGRWFDKQGKFARVDYKEALMFATGFVAEAEYDSTIFCRFPSEWINEGEAVVEPEKLEQIFQLLYGANWRSGNTDGSRYLVLRPEIHAFTPAEAEAEPWRNVSLQDKNHHYWFFKTSDAREIVRIQQAEF